MSNLHETTELNQALEALEIVETVSYEFPGVWHINLKSGKTYYLGDVNGNWGWDDGQGDMSGDTFETSAPEIARAFSEWVESLPNDWTEPLTTNRDTHNRDNLWAFVIAPRVVCYWLFDQLKKWTTWKYI